MAAIVQTRAGWFAAVALVCNSFVIVVVNACIYWSRAAYFARHPEASALQPPTISKAISDPAIGEPFAFWITASAVFLFVGVTALALITLSGLPRRARALRAVIWLVVPAQLATCIGMVVLSHYTFPDHNDLHMAGSYLFFVSQSVVMLLWLIVAVTLVFAAGTLAAMHRAAVLHPPMNRVRLVLCSATILVGALYGYLFLTKTDPAWGDWQEWVYLAYVSTEPALISMFLFVCLSFHIDLWLLLKRSGLLRRKTPAEP